MATTIEQEQVILYSPVSCRVSHFRMLDGSKMQLGICDVFVAVTDENLITTFYDIEEAHEIFESLFGAGWR